MCEGVLIILGFQAGLEAGRFIPFWLNQPGLGIQINEDLLSTNDPENVISPYEHDLDHGVRFKKNIDVIIKAFAIPDKQIEKKLPEWRIVTNDSHHRVSDQKKKINSNELLVVLGGSSPFGWGVNFEDSFPALLADSGDKPLRLMNLAEPGYTIYDSFLLYKKFRSFIKKNGEFRIIIDGGSNNNTLSTMSDVDARLFRLSYFGKIRLLLSQTRLYWLVKSFLKERLKIEEHMNKQRISIDEYKIYLAALLDMVTNDNGKIIIMNICNSDSEIIQVMQEYSEKYRATFFDVNAFFDSQVDSLNSSKDEDLKGLIDYYTLLYGAERIKNYPRWLLEFHKNCHPNKLGNKLIANEMEKIIHST